MPPPSVSSYSLLYTAHVGRGFACFGKGGSCEARGPGHPWKTTLVTVSLGNTTLLSCGQGPVCEVLGSGQTVALMKGKINLPIFARWLWHNGGSRKLQCDMCNQGPIRVPANGCNIPYSPKFILRRGYSLTQQQQ